MGNASGFVCGNCGKRVDYATDDFDYGFSGRITTPVLCSEHGVQQVDTGLDARRPGWEKQKRNTYPCPVCGQTRPLWNHRTCPVCGQERMEPDSKTLILWD